MCVISPLSQKTICPLHEAHQHAACCVHHQALELVLLCGSCASGRKDCDVETHFVVLETLSMENLWERDWRKTNKLHILAFSSASLVLLLGHQIQRLLQLLHSLTLGAWGHEIKRDVAAAAGALGIALVQHDVHQTTSASTRHQSTEACCCRPRLSGRFHAFFSLGGRSPETKSKTHTETITNLKTQLLLLLLRENSDLQLPQKQHCWETEEQAEAQAIPKFRAWLHHRYKEFANPISFSLCGCTLD